MKNGAIATYRRLLRASNYSTQRYLLRHFNLKSRLTGLVGPRGTGKTTLMLQYIQQSLRVEHERGEVIYVSLDSIFFANTRLISFVEDLYETEGVRVFFFDEIHKYANWNQELKNIYDSYPDIKIIFSGSSSLDLIKGGYDLSRRGHIYKISGLSFREFLYFKSGKEFPVLSLEQLLSGNGQEIDEIVAYPKLRGLFKDYLRYGYYPFMFEDRDNYHAKLLNVIDKTIYDDIANFYSLKTENLTNFKKIMVCLATIPPGELNRNSIAKHIGLDNKTVQHYLQIMSETGLTRLVSIDKSGSSLLKATEKIFLDNPNSYQAISNEIGHESKQGTVREIFFVTMLENSGHKIFYSKIGDFSVNRINFEIGGKGKSKRQIKSDLQNSYLVKDDTLYGSKYEIPLLLFGFLY